MISNFNIKKTTQAAAYLLSLSNGRMPYLKLLKLLYLADRKSLQVSEHSITGDQYFSMTKGPVLSATYNLIKSKGVENYWNNYIQTKPHDVYMVNKPGKGELSPYDIEILDQINCEFGGWDRWQLVEYTHKLPEWVDPGTTSKEISFQALLAGLGYHQKDIQRIINNLENQSKIDMLLD